MWAFSSCSSFGIEKMITPPQFRILCTSLRRVSRASSLRCSTTSRTRIGNQLPACVMKASGLKHP